MVITAETRIHDISIQFPASISVLEGFEIDDRSTGEDTLKKRCARHHLNLASVLEALNESQREIPPSDPWWEKSSLPEMVEFIVRTHHAYAREQIKLSESLIAEVECRHASDHLEVFQISKIFAVMSAELIHSFYWEENLIFPYIAQLGTEAQTGQPALIGGLQQLIARMMAEHDQTAHELRVLREVTNNYAPPRVVCPTWRALYGALEDFERDLHQHLHLENCILFPRALEQARKAS